MPLHIWPRRTPGRAPACCRFRPPELPPTFFSWILPVFTLSDVKFAACAGFDALAYVQSLRLMGRIAVYVLLITCAAVLPTNLSGSDVQRRLVEQEATGFDVDACGGATESTNAQLAVRPPASGCCPVTPQPARCVFSTFALMQSKAWSAVEWFFHPPAALVCQQLQSRLAVQGDR